jgi:hypothetical protein
MQRNDQVKQMQKKNKLQDLSAAWGRVHPAFATRGYGMDRIRSNYFHDTMMWL